MDYRNYIKSISFKQRCEFQMVFLLINFLNNIPAMFRRTKQLFSSTVNPQDLRRFNSVNDWWQVGGSMQALWQYNYTRVKYIHRMLGLQAQQNSLANYRVLDVGVGGGILSEVTQQGPLQSLRRLGANVLGIDVSEQSIKTAVGHKNNDPQLRNDDQLKYVVSSPEQLATTSVKFNMITAMEVIEHVENKAMFVESLSQLLEPGGTLFLSTIDKSNESLVKMIIAAEYLTRIVPIGTHQWDLFISAKDLTGIMEKYGLEINNVNIIPTKQIQGVDYNIITGEMMESENLTQYILTAKRRTGQP